MSAAIPGFLHSQEKQKELFLQNKCQGSSKVAQWVKMLAAEAWQPDFES